MCLMTGFTKDEPMANSWFGRPEQSNLGRIIRVMLLKPTVRVETVTVTNCGVRMWAGEGSPKA